MILRDRIEMIKRAITVPEYFRTAGLHAKGLGANRSVLCPFHKEKSPSCYLYSDHYHCYGCGEHGDVIDAHQKIKKVDFCTALEDLGRMAGLNRYHPERTPGRAGGINPTRNEKE